MASNSDGSFTISVAGNKAVLIVSNVGFATREIPVTAGSDNLIIELQPASGEADELVVVGYGRKSRKNLAGSIVSVNADEIRNIPMASPDQLLQGKAAGVQIASQSGTPGGGVTVRIRGTSSFSPKYPGIAAIIYHRWCVCKYEPVGTSRFWYRTTNFQPTC